jgi:hypothetical protein
MAVPTATQTVDTRALGNRLQHIETPEGAKTIQRAAKVR